MQIATGRRLKLHQFDQSGCSFSRIFIPDSAKAETTSTLLLTWTAWQVGSGYCTTIAEISGVDEPTTRRALKLFTNRSMVALRKANKNTSSPQWLPSSFAMRGGS